MYFTYNLQLPLPPGYISLLFPSRFSFMITFISHGRKYTLRDLIKASGKTVCFYIPLGAHIPRGPYLSAVQSSSKTCLFISQKRRFQQSACQEYSWGVSEIASFELGFNLFPEKPD